MNRSLDINDLLDLSPTTDQKASLTASKLHWIEITKYLRDYGPLDMSYSEFLAIKKKCYGKTNGPPKDNHFSFLCAEFYNPYETRAKECRGCPLNKGRLYHGCSHDYSWKFFCEWSRESKFVIYNGERLYRLPIKNTKVVLKNADKFLGELKIELENRK